MPFFNILFAGGMITKVAVIIAIVASLGLGGSMFLAKRDFKALQKKHDVLTETNQQLETNNAILKQNNLTLKSSLDTAAEANQVSATANKKLLDERKSAKEAIDAIARSKAKDRDALNAANKKIDEMLKNPKNDGVVAPVLSETIRDIQKRGKK